MVVDDPHGLHPGIDNCRANELEAPALHPLGDLLGQRRRCDPVAAATLQYLAVGERPAEVTEALAPVLHLAEDLSAPDRRFDLGSGADDSRVGHQALDIRLAESR